MTKQNNSSRPAAHPLRILPFLVACVVLLLAHSAGFAQNPKVDITGKTNVVSSPNKITGDATGTALKAARTGPDFHITVTGLPSDHALQLDFGFAELEKTAAGQRLFNVEVNDKRALTGFDIIQAAGGPFRSIVKRFTITPSGGKLDMHFTGLIGDAAINYIQISGPGVKTLISAPLPASARAEAVPSAEDDYIPADDQVSFDAEAGTIDLDGTSDTWNSGIPIGGIGTGKFELLPNGQFANFTINNSWDLPVLRPRGTFLAIAAKATSGQGGGRLLQVNPSDQRGDPIYPDYAGMSQGKFTGQFPVGKLEMKDEKFPLEVTVEGWSPLIPNNVADSALPAGVVGVTIRNPQKYPLSIGVVFSWEDISGRGGSLLPNDQHGFTVASQHKDSATSEVTGVQIASMHLQQDRAATFTGDYFLGTPIKGAVITRTLAWNPRTKTIPWWKSFTRRLRLERIPSTPATSTGQKNGTGPIASAVCVSFNLAPKEVRRVPFIVSWYAPKIITVDSQSGQPTQEAQDYAERFGSSVGVASYLAAHRDSFRDLTNEWTEMIARATVPQWLKSHTLNSLFPLHSNTILLKNDRFAMLESPADMKGMLGPVDLKLGASDFLLTMFPELEKSELNLYARAQDSTGRIPRYVGNIHGALSGFDTELLGSKWYDPTSSWLLEVGRYWRETGDDATLQALKPAITRARDFLVTQIESPDSAADTNIFRALGGYSSADQMSRIKALAALQVTQDILQDSSDHITTLLNTELGKINLSETTATFAPALAGVYAARAAGSRRLLDQANISAYLDKIQSENFAPSKPVPLMQAPADNAAKSAVAAPAPLQAYVGELALQAGRSDIGLEPYLRMFQIAYGAQKAPWKQALLYDVPAAAKPSMRYHRSAMAAWSAWRGLSGVVYDRPNQRLFIHPVSITTATADMEVPVFAPSFWAWLKYNAAASTGTLAITKVIGETTPTLSSVATGIGIDGAAENLVSFPEPLTLEEGATISFDGWPGKSGATVTAAKPAPPPVPADLLSSGSLALNDPATSNAKTTGDDTESSETAHVPQSSPETAEGEEMAPDEDVTTPTKSED
jgi:uncharacterized protein (DUF608 family)